MIGEFGLMGSESKILMISSSDSRLSMMMGMSDEFLIRWWSVIILPKSGFLSVSGDSLFIPNGPKPPTGKLLAMSTRLALALE